MSKDPSSDEEEDGEQRCGLDCECDGQVTAVLRNNAAMALGAQQPLLSANSIQSAGALSATAVNEEYDQDDWGELLDSDDGSDGQLEQSTGAGIPTDVGRGVASGESSEAESDSASGSEGRDGGAGVRVLASISLGHGARLCVSAGSVLDFGEGRTGWPRARTAVVNAANTGGLGGGGVDGAFVSEAAPGWLAIRRHYLS